ncbi:enoyl-CoA hydratase/isomerase family protein [Rhizobium sp. BK251]|uniref:enoyl-CoA hydratase/isomerase family protein n=1 Tax=Rhizobium sp. BK251 TaxID=2512125 RepID=UPI001047D0B1|nr:enoyl-CoA hydratase/isomerase family protein [Rhizobium sp. BK251]
MQDDATGMSEVIVERRGAAGVIRLNRPRALNSLTTAMVREMAGALERFAADPGIASVVVLGEGDRGLCAGGDIRVLHESGRAGTGEAETFWREEFHLDHAISGYPKPYVVFMDGITMGGGVGISAHGSHRIVTERTRLAMPETGIGYFPDIGATWLLPRARGETGTWMGLTGLDINAADALHAGLADYCVSASTFPEILKAIGELPATASPRQVNAAITAFAAVPGESALAAHAELIDRAFRFDSVEEILAALAREKGDFAARTRATIESRSPTSLKLTLRLLRAGRESRSLAECLERELGACMQILHNPDFFEGVRAAVIDKDRNPKWVPARIEDVSDAMIERFFRKPEPPLFP